MYALVQMAFACKPPTHLLQTRNIPRLIIVLVTVAFMEVEVGHFLKFELVSAVVIPVCIFAAYLTQNTWRVENSLTTRWRQFL